VDETVQTVDGRTIGFATFGPRDGVPVVWCHGGPGSRLEPSTASDAATAAGLLIVGIDRPGYGLSTPKPDRTIGEWVTDALAVAGCLSLDRFYVVGVSTGGAYALALAALAPERVLGVVACCAMTDMRNGPARSSMAAELCHALWDAPDRASAVAAAEAAFGKDGSLMLGGELGQLLAPSDLALFEDPAFLEASAVRMPAMFAWGVEGYADDRLADGPGWATFDIADVTCPVTVLHGESDKVVDVIHAHHTVSVLRDARLELHPELGHLSIMAEVVPAIAEMVDG
jgi:pimeloyl-ACP methyl ester carboxylesterase